MYWHSYCYIIEIRRGKMNFLEKTSLYKLVAVFMSFIFLSSSVVTAGPVNTPSPSLPENTRLILNAERINDLFIPENYGSIVKKWRLETVENNKSVILIQTDSGRFWILGTQYLFS